MKWGGGRKERRKNEGMEQREKEEKKILEWYILFLIFKKFNVKV